MAGINLTDITSTGIDNAVPETRTLTIGGVTYDLSQNRTWAGGGGGTGTVTSVDMSVPTGFQITGNPITTSGTLALAFASGYALPTTVKQSNWDDAYTFVTGFPSQTGNNGKYLTTDGSVLSWATVAALTDGDKGDITVSGSGSTWSIDNGVVDIANLSATGTPSSTTYLRGDNTWATVSGGGGSPGGTTGEVQYNNAGSFAGAANVEIDGGDLTLVDAGFPASPAAGRTKVFTDSMATRRLVGSVDSAGNHFDFQPALFNSTTYMWLAGTGTTLAINWGTSYTARNNGTNAAQAHPIRNNLSAINSMNRATFSTGTTATGASGIQSASTNAWRGSSAGLGGFFFFARFALEARSGTHRLFVGLSENNATLNAQPSTLNNTLGIGLDSADTNLQFMIRNTATTTRIDTTIAADTTTIYDFYMYCEPNGSTIYFELRNALTNAVLKNSQETANLPSNTSFFYMQAHIQSVTGTTAKLLALNRMYLESNL
jgi:hypothetical protein